MMTSPIIVDSRGTEYYPEVADVEETAAMLESGMSTNEVASVLVSRFRTAQRLGLQFGGQRDMYKVLGYKTELENADYINSYLRDDIASRIVNLPPNDTWRKSPVLIDGGERSDQDDTSSEFLAAWNNLVDEKRVIHYLQRLDRLARLGRYAVLLLGVRDGKELKERFDSQLNGPEDLLYLSPKHEDMSGIANYERDHRKPNFARPTDYDIQIGGLEFEFNLGTKRVHASRVLHVAEDPLDNDVYGIPALKKIMNRMDDLAKVVGGSAEALWKNMRKGVAFVAENGMQFAPQPGSKEQLKKQLDEYDHGLRRILTLGGVKPYELGADIVDPSGNFEIILALLSAASGIPQRILIGSERGELASSQDMTAWNNVISDRQANYAEPSILRPFIRLLINHGILPQPKSGKYKVEWSAAFELTEIQKAERAQNLSIAIKNYVEATGVVDIVEPNEFREHILSLPARDVEPIDVEGGPTREEQEAFIENQRLVLQLMKG